MGVVVRVAQALQLVLLLLVGVVLRVGGMLLELKGEAEEEFQTGISLRVSCLGIATCLLNIAAMKQYLFCQCHSTTIYIAPKF